ncbi:MAG: OmpA family protein [Gammaproteobacteria bacterium]|nr:OmpA family protein [Gammaproteobacteria bacterium]
MNSLKTLKMTAIAAAVAVGAAGCASTSEVLTGENANAAKGAIIGAISGAVVGNNTGSSKNRDRNRVLGAIAGATAGGVIGKKLDDQEREMRERLAAEQQRREIEVQRVAENTLKLTLNSEVSFDTDSAEVKAAFQPSLNKVAEVLASYPDFGVLVIGHTDSVGSDQYNQALSERRASSVANYLSGRGVAYGRLQAAGRGESEPRANNDTADGRAMNRRVEIFIQGADGA